MPKETQRKTSKIVKSSGGKLTLEPHRKNLQQRFNGIRHYLSLVILNLNTYGGLRCSMSHVCQPLSAPLLIQGHPSERAEHLLTPRRAGCVFDYFERLSLHTNERLELIVACYQVFSYIKRHATYGLAVKKIKLPCVRNIASYFNLSCNMFVFVFHFEILSIITSPAVNFYLIS